MPSRDGKTFQKSTVGIFAFVDGLSMDYRASPKDKLLVETGADTRDMGILKFSGHGNER